MIDESFTDADIAELHDAGVRGTRFNFVAHLGGAPELDEFWRIVHRVVPFGWHIVLHFDAKDLARLRRRCSTTCRAPTSSTTWRGSTRVGGRRAGAVPPTARADGATSAAGSRSPAPNGSRPAGRRRTTTSCRTRRALIAAAPDRVLWGTDWPHPNVRHMPDDGDLVDLLADYAPDEATRNRILVDNPTVLYDFRLYDFAELASPSASTRRTSYGPRIE